MLDEDDFGQLPLATTHEISVLEFVPAEQIDPLLYEKAYYLDPDKVGLRAYSLLRDALAMQERIAIVKVAFRTREQLATLRARGKVLVLDTLRWPDEIRPVSGLKDLAALGAAEVKPRPQELKMARSMIASMTHDFKPDNYTDRYRDALAELIHAKLKGRHLDEQATPASAAEAGSGVVDLMAALKASMAKMANAKPAAEKPGPKKTAKTTAPATKRTARKSA